MSYQARCYIRRVLSALALAIVIFVIRREWHLTGFSNAMAISGICFLIMALFQTARYLRCYDLIIFGFLKFKQLWKNEKFMDKHTGSLGNSWKTDGTKKIMEKLLLRLSVCLYARLWY